ncbi:apolipoprotein N-acyltransferase [Gammaproteobacteria bacterium]|nr:apolipoprotein N-acyltransferase [Gammaproteobacteria bacterium]
MKILNFIIPALFGLIGIFAFAPFSIKFLIFISYGYLIHLLISNNNGVFWKVFCWGLGHWGLGMSWIIVSVYYYGETTIAMSSIIYILLVVILTLIFTSPLLILKSALSFTKINNNFFSVLFISSIFTISEFSRYFFLNGVPWLIPGNIFLDTISQNIYPIFGVTAASFFIYFICALFIVYSNNKIFYVSAAILIISLLPFSPADETKDGIKVSIVQPASDPFLKYDDNYYLKIEDNLNKLIDTVSKDSELVVLPEAELPYSQNSLRFINFLKNTEISEKIILGVWKYEDAKLYNAIFSPRYNEAYKKIHLVPFGEYIPFIEGLRGIINFFDLPMSNVSHGSQLQENIRILDNIPISSPICFDIAFPNTVRNMNKSSLLMINVSNDTWFGNSIGPYHHLSIARVRSIENNRYTIRATNDGISAIISNKGTIVTLLDKGKSGILEGNVKLIKNSTFYSRNGHLFFIILSFIIVLIPFLKIIWKKALRS